MPSTAVTRPGPETDPAWLADPQAQPLVSVIIPMYNEERHIAACLRAVLDQDYPPGKLEILVVDGASTDRSAAVVEEQFITVGAPVQLLHNAGRKTPHSLNIGLEAAGGEVIVILGAHAEVLPGFLQLNLENLRRPDVVCCGGTLVNAGGTPKQVSIGVAMSHPFAMAVPHRYRRKPGFMKTAVYGAYRREIFETIGRFEENWTVPDDADLNHRLTHAGYKIYYDPRIQTRYFPRETIRSLGRQMLGYGFRRAQMLRRHYGAISWFHFVPPFFLLVLAGLAAGAVFSPPARYLLVLLLLIYGALVSAFALDARRRQSQGRIVWIALAFISIQLSWGYGFINGLLTLNNESPA